MSENPKVFISYSHQGANYEARILEFANHLRSEGIDANVDLYEEAPKEGWPRWMENQINNSEFVLVVCSKSYYEKCYSDDKKSKGISWEVNIVYQHLYDGTSINTKFIPVFFEKEDEQFILTPLKPFTYYNIGQKDEYEKLYWRLRGVSKTQKPPLGKLKPVPQKEQKTMFFSTPIDLEKWNDAMWKGAAYLFCPGEQPILGLCFKNFDAAKSIFSDWKKIIKYDYGDRLIKIDFIIPPFPNNCWVYADKKRNYGRGYFIHIGPNLDESIKRAMSSGLQKEDYLIATVSRYQWMDELTGSKNRDLFQHLTKDGLGYSLIPIGIKNESLPFNEGNLILGFDYAIQMKKVTFRSGVRIEENDICRCVLDKEVKTL